MNYYMVLPALAINAASKPRLAASALHTALLSNSIIGASLREPHLDELAGAFLWYIYIYNYMYIVSMGRPFGPAWARKRATRKRKAG